MAKRIPLYAIEATFHDGRTMRDDGPYIKAHAENVLKVKQVESQHPFSRLNIWGGSTNHRIVKTGRTIRGL